jgi:hypothetical protein
VDKFTRIDAVAGMGAAFTGVRSPWASPVSTSASPVFKWASLALARPKNDRMQHQILSVGNRRALMAATMPTASETRNQTAKKTRVSAGRYGAMGPHPEREPA